MKKFRQNKFTHNPDVSTSIFIDRRDGTRLICTVDTIDYPLVARYRWHANKDGASYYVTTNARKADGSLFKLRLHRLLLPNAVEVDHIGIRSTDNTLNNRRSNLRDATHSQNNINKKKRKTSATSSFLGVSYKKSRKKFQVHIKALGKLVYLGLFKDETDAAHAYDAAARKHFGEFARLNFPEFGECAASQAVAA